MSGSLLQNQNVTVQSGQLQLDFSGRNNLSSGMYVLKISQNNRVLLTEKVMRR
jgi:hypothetical protein